MILIQGESRFHDHGEVEAQGSDDSKVYSIDTAQKRGVQNRQGEDNIGLF